jgi:hypothetical protein
VRADVLHQCDASSPLFNATWKKMTIATAAFFKGTVLLVLDREMAVLDWTWLITRPPLQIATWADHGREYVPAGVSGGFTPPWSQQVYDARLLNLDGRHLLVTYNCAACTFSVSPVHLERKLTADGGLHMLQAWTPQRIQVWDKWLQGRNQALFVAPDMTAASGLSVLIQPWIGIIGSLAVCTILYVLFAHVLTGIVNYTELNSAAPVAVAIERTDYRWLRPVIKLAIIAGYTSVILVMLLGQSRVFFSMSRDGLLPKLFCDVHPRFRTPWRSAWQTSWGAGLRCPWARPLPTPPPRSRCRS